LSVLTNLFSIYFLKNNQYKQESIKKSMCHEKQYEIHLKNWWICEYR